jgi:hypothetical protein
MFEPVMVVPISIIAAAIIGYLAVKNHWKIADYF